MYKTLAVLAVLALSALPGMATANGKGKSGNGSGGGKNHGPVNIGSIFKNTGRPVLQQQVFNKQGIHKLGIHKLGIQKGIPQAAFNKKFQHSSQFGKNFRVQWNAGRWYGKSGHRWWDARRGCYIYHFPGQRNYCCYSMQQGCYVPIPMTIPMTCPQTTPPVDEGLPLPPDDMGAPAEEQIDPTAPIDPAVPATPVGLRR